jgi:hypothetical protein
VRHGTGRWKPPTAHARTAKTSKPKSETVFNTRLVWHICRAPGSGRPGCRRGVASKPGRGDLVGIWDVPALLDGGFITAPRGGFFSLDGEWEVENRGVPPDIEVEQLPADIAAGRDPQLEKGVEVALELLREQGIELKKQPPDPVRVRRAK